MVLARIADTIGLRLSARQPFREEWDCKNWALGCGAVRKECVSIDQACSGPSAFLFALSLRYLSALDAGADQVDGLVRLGPAQQLHPFALFEILVMLEEMSDLLEQDLRQIAI